MTGGMEMGKYGQYVTHKGKRILFINAARKSEAECLAAFDEMEVELLKDMSGVLVLIDVTGLKLTNKVIDRAKAVTARTKEVGYHDKASAVVGLSGLQKSVAQLFARGTHWASSMEEAKEWLVKEDDKRG